MKTNGDVYAVIGGSTTFTSLDGISFYAGPGLNDRKEQGMTEQDQIAIVGKHLSEMAGRIETILMRIERKLDSKTDKSQLASLDRRVKKLELAAVKVKK